MLLWCVIAGIPFVVIGLGSWVKAPQRPTKPFDPGAYRVLVELHRVQRRFEVFQFKVETLRLEQHAWRQMAKELRELRRKEGG